MVERCAEVVLYFGDLSTWMVGVEVGPLHEACLVLLKVSLDSCHSPFKSPSLLVI